MSFQNKTGEAFKNLLESQGDDAAVAVVIDLIESKKIRPEDFSLKELWEACTIHEFGKSIPVTEAVASTSFPKITGELINSKIISAYNSLPTIGDQLVTTVPSNVENETIAGFTEAETPERVPEGDEYRDSTLTEKYVTAQSAKYGRMISVTEEMIYFDKVGQVMNRAGRIGLKAAQYKEKIIVEGVQDINSNVYKPSGVPEAFYSTSRANGANSITSNQFGDAGLEAVMVLAAGMKDDSLSPENNDYVYIDPMNTTLLVPSSLMKEAWEMANGVLVPETAENAPNYWKGRFNPVTSPYVDQQSTSTWYWGDFKQDFWWLEVWPLQVMNQKPGHDDAFKADIKARVKVRFFGTIAAIDAKHSFKSAA